jgi:hypothetical protein
VNVGWDRRPAGTLLDRDLTELPDLTCKEKPQNSKRRKNKLKF